MRDMEERFEENMNFQKRNNISAWLSKNRLKELEEMKKSTRLKKKASNNNNKEKENIEETEERGVTINFYKERMAKNEIYSTREKLHGARKRKV
jgi:hypothetical protein